MWRARTASIPTGGTDWELEPYGGMVDEAWGLRVRYDFPIILREAVEEHFAKT